MTSPPRYRRTKTKKRTTTTETQSHRDLAPPLAATQQDRRSREGLGYSLPGHKHTNEPTQVHVEQNESVDSRRHDRGAAERRRALTTDGAYPRQANPSRCTSGWIASPNVSEPRRGGTSRRERYDSIGQVSPKALMPSDESSPDDRNLKLSSRTTFPLPGSTAAV